MKKVYRPNKHTTIEVEARKPKLYELAILMIIIAAITYYIIK